MEVRSELVQKLMEVGYMASGGGMPTEAAAIFEAVQAVRPESELPLIGLAVGKLNANRADEAIVLLRQALAKNADSEYAAAFLGLALKQAGMSQASEDILRQVVQSGKCEQAVGLAKSLLE